MQKQVKAAVIEGPGKISIQHFPYPDLEQYQGSVLKVTQCGICGTDKHSYRGETRQNSGSDTEFNVAYPYIMGHEAVGIWMPYLPVQSERTFMVKNCILVIALLSAPILSAANATIAALHRGTRGVKILLANASATRCPSHVNPAYSVQMPNICSSRLKPICIRFRMNCPMTLLCSLN